MRRLSPVQKVIVFVVIMILGFAIPLNFYVKDIFIYHHVRPLCFYALKFAEGCALGIFIFAGQFLVGAAKSLSKQR